MGEWLPKLRKRSAEQLSGIDAAAASHAACRPRLEAPFPFPAPSAPSAASSGGRRTRSQGDAEPERRCDLFEVDGGDASTELEESDDELPLARPGSVVSAMVRDSRHVATPNGAASAGAPAAACPSVRSASTFACNFRSAASGSTSIGYDGPGTDCGSTCRRLDDAGLTTGIPEAPAPAVQRQRLRPLLANAGGDDENDCSVVCGSIRAQTAHVTHPMAEAVAPTGAAVAITAPQRLQPAGVTEADRAQNSSTDRGNITSSNNGSSSNNICNRLNSNTSSGINLEPHSNNSNTSQLNRHPLGSRQPPFLSGAGRGDGFTGVRSMAQPRLAAALAGCPALADTFGGGGGSSVSSTASTRTGIGHGGGPPAPASPWLLSATPGESEFFSALAALPNGPAGFVQTCANSGPCTESGHGSNSVGSRGCGSEARCRPASSPHVASARRTQRQSESGREQTSLAESSGGRRPPIDAPSSSRSSGSSPTLGGSIRVAMTDPSVENAGASRTLQTSFRSHGTLPDAAGKAVPLADGRRRFPLRGDSQTAATSSPVVDITCSQVEHHDSGDDGILRHRADTGPTAQNAWVGGGGRLGGRRRSSLASDWEIARLLQQEEEAEAAVTTASSSSSSRARALAVPDELDSEVEEIQASGASSSLSSSLRAATGSIMDRAMSRAVAQGGALAAAALAAASAAGLSRRPPAARPPRDRSSNSELPGQHPAGRWLFSVESCRRTSKCHGCQSRISCGELQVFYRRQVGRGVHASHPACLTLIANLGRPPPSLPSSGFGGSAAAEDLSPVRYGFGVDGTDRALVEAHLAELPLAAPTLDDDEQHRQLLHTMGFLDESAEEPPVTRRRQNHARAPVSGGRGAPGRGSASGGRGAPGRGSLQRRLLSTDRDFNAEDYEMLLQLDEGRSSSSRHQQEAQSLLSLLPVSTVAASAAGSQCMVCLDTMDAGAEVRTLPCMHVFHRHCIDRWLAEPGRPPRCPIDQSKVEVA
ncbi:unnamed protein product [Polarella glacialis]|uniref:RING-type domain-containing protein n=1 Tax=Polarella glacialis TaxID=89957 RepID=A0A813LIR8_POLGL|nr:unnamed protein product [Polarella glacialis]